jgi:hypothetical protein
MRAILVNTKQKVAILASGLAIATTGLVTDTSPDKAQAKAPADQPAKRSTART